MSKEELELTRQELKNSATALAEQSETLKIQRFEQTFFSLLGRYDDIVDGIKINTPKQGRVLNMPEIIEKYGSEAIGYQNRNLRRKLFDVVGESANYHTREELIDICSDFLEENKKYILEPYSGIIQHILYFIDISDIEDRQMYADILKTNLTEEELFFLFYRYLYRHDKTTMSRIIKYGLFENIQNKTQLIDEEIDLQIFEELKQEIELAQTVKERLAENDTPIRVSIDSL